VNLSLLPPRWRRLAVAVLAAGMAVAGWWSRGRFAAPSPTSSTALISDLSLRREGGSILVSDPARLPRAEVLSVVDGDTLWIRFNGVEQRLRYVGINTTERGEACYEEASARNEALAGREVLLAFDARPHDRYERLLAYVFTPDGRSIESVLVEEGLARAWTRDGRWRDGFEALEKEARQAKRGCLWSREDPPQPRSRRARSRKRRS
jgi:endonuclease YncB( thermonuclease family)